MAIKRVFFIFLVAVQFPAAAHAAAGTEAIKLPYAKGERFIVVQGYDSPPTHVKKDYYAIDFSQNGCDAYAKFAVAASAGKVMLAEENGYNGGYGTQILINNGNDIVSRYAHLIPGTISVNDGDTVAQGQPLGQIGNTGLVDGYACLIHPGTHLHFAMYSKKADGSFLAYQPEPISNYTDIAEGKWYLSDNDIPPSGGVSGLSADIGATAKVAPPENDSDIPPASESQNLNAASDTNPQAFTTNITTTEPMASQTTATSTATTAPSAQSTTVRIGGVSATPPPSSLPSPPVQTSDSSGNLDVQTSSTPTSTIPVSSTSSISLTISTTIIATSTITTSTTPVLNTIQPIDSETSNGSWYDDNWYDLGTGFYGEIQALTLEGFADSSDYFKSHLWLQEYLDPNYTELNQTFTISDDAPFTNAIQKITISGLNIPLQPNKYYRLQTYQDYQNRSVILLGTSATGTAMWNVFIYGTGRMEYTYPFYPFLSALMIPNYPPLMPPEPPANMKIGLDSLNSIIYASWPAAMDPDTTSSLLTYEFNISTSTVFDETAWRPLGKVLSASSSVVFPNSYFVGVRARDDLNNVSQPLIVPWNFPSNYEAVPSQLDHSAMLPGIGAQEVMFAATTTITGIALWTQPQFVDPYCCSQSFISLHLDNGGTMGDEIASSDPIIVNRANIATERLYTFDSSPIVSPGAYWFLFEQGPSGNTNGTNIYGSPDDSYASGEWSTSPGQDAYFRIQQVNGP